jgi:putative transposase
MLAGPKADPENEGAGGVAGYRHGHRSRSLLGTFGRVDIAVPRARLDTAEGKTREWKSKAPRAYQRRTKQADSLIAGAYPAGTNTRPVRGRSLRCLAVRSAKIRRAGCGER